MLSYLFALSPSLLFGTFSLLLGRLHGDDKQKVFGIFAGGLVAALVATPFLGVHWTPKVVVVSVVSGLFMFFGLRDQTLCLRVLGVSRTMPISTGFQLVTVSLGGVILMGEWRSPGAMPVGMAAIALLVAGIWLTSLREQGTEGAQLDWPRGIRLLITSTIGLAGFMLTSQYFGISGRDAFLPQAIAWSVAALLLTGPRFIADGGPVDTRFRKQTIPFVFVGMIWGVAILLIQLTSNLVGVATGFTLAQLGIIISTLGGIWWIGEHRTRKELVWTLLGLALVIAGAVVVGIAKGLDG